MDLLRSCNKERPQEYLKNRGLKLMPPGAKLLSKKDAADLTGKRYPAMVIPILNHNHLLQGAHVTFLTSDATANLSGKDGNVRRMFGQAKGGFVRLGKIDPDQPMIVGEGVETVLAAMQIAGITGGIAALSSSNMKDVELPHCAEVIIAEDNDNAGREAAKALAQRLAVPGRIVRIARPPGHKDWNNTLLDPEVDFSRARLDICSAPKQRTEESDNRTFAVGMTSFLSLEFPKRQCLLKPWLKTGDLAMLIADGGVGKTHLALSIGYAVASGRSLMNWPCEHRAKVLYVDGEMAGEELQRWMNELGPKLPDEDFCVLAQSYLEAHNREMPDINTEEGRKFLDAEVERSGATLIILDSVSTLVQSGVDNEVESWRAIQRWSIRHRARGRTILYLHHTNASKTRGRGTSARFDVLGAALLLKARDDLTADTGTAVELSYPKHRGFHGKDILPQIVRFTTANGYIEWTSELKPDEQAANADVVADMLERGMKQSQIATELGLTKGRVSQIVSKMQKARVRTED